MWLTIAYKQLQKALTGSLLPIAPAEPAGDRPIDEERSADDLAFREFAPITRVKAAHGVVAHDH